MNKNQRKNKKDHVTINSLTIILFIIYLIALFWILLFKTGVQFSYMRKGNVNLIPFSDTLDLTEIILNIIVFVPLGIYTGVVFNRWTFGKKLFFFFLISLLVEGLQFILRVGAFDVTDIVTNTLGGIIGLVIFEGIGKLFNNHVKAENFINIIAAVGTVIMISLLLLLKLNMLPIRFQ